MEELVAKSIKLPRELVDAVEHRANELGLTFADVLEAGLRKEVNMPTNPRTDLLTQVGQWLLEQYPDKKGFPAEVTLTVFRKIKADSSFWTVYEAAITNSSGEEDESLRWTLHRQIGQAVRRVLDAQVIGRSVELDPEVELIKTHALLVPQN